MPSRSVVAILGLGLVLACGAGGLPPAGPKKGSDPLTGRGLTPFSDPAQPDSPRKAKRVLLLGQGPDGHARTTHEYMAGVNLLAKCLSRIEGLQTVVVQADEPWEEGPELIDGADGVVLYLSQGAKWIHQDPKRLAALQRLAERRGGFVALHWGMGCREAEHVPDFLKLFGGCHGGPDRKYQIVTVLAQVANVGHPIMRKIGPFEVKEEFYYQLKFVEPLDMIKPLLRVPIDGESHTVAWAWERPDGGRSFGFSGGHYHENWRLEPYRRMVAQAVLWTVDLPVPEEGLPVEVLEQDLKLAD